MSRAKIPNLRSFQNGLIPLSRASTRRRYSPILGITSWYQSLLRPRSPHWLIESLTVESSHTLKNILSPILYRRVGFLCFSSPFSLVRTPDVCSCLSYLQNLHKIFLGIPRVFWDCFDVLVTRILFSMPPVTEELSFGVSLTQVYRGSTKYLRRPTSKISPIRPVAR